MFDIIDFQQSSLLCRRPGAARIDFVLDVVFVASAHKEHLFVASEARALQEAGASLYYVSLASMLSRGDDFERVVSGQGMVVFFAISAAEQSACVALAAALARRGHTGYRACAQVLFWPGPRELLQECPELHGTLTLRARSSLTLAVQRLAARRSPAGLPGLAWRGLQGVVHRAIDPDSLHVPAAHPAGTPAAEPPFPAQLPRHLGMPVAPILTSLACHGGCPGCVAGAGQWDRGPMGGGRAEGPLGSDPPWGADIVSSYAAGYQRGAWVYQLQSPDPWGIDLTFAPHWPRDLGQLVTEKRIAEGDSTRFVTLKMLSDEVTETAVESLVHLGVMRVSLRHRLRLPRLRVYGPFSETSHDDRHRDQVLERALSLLVSNGISVEAHLLAWEPAPAPVQIAATLDVLERWAPLPYRLVWLPSFANASFRPPAGPHEPGSGFIRTIAHALPRPFHGLDGVVRALADVLFLRNLVERLEVLQETPGLTAWERYALAATVSSASACVFDSVRALLASAEKERLSARRIKEARNALEDPVLREWLDTCRAFLVRAAARIAGREELPHEELCWTSSGHEACSFGGWPHGAAQLPWPMAWWPLLAGLGVGAAALALAGAALPGSGDGADADLPGDADSPGQGPAALGPSPEAPAEPAIPDSGPEAEGRNKGPALMAVAAVGAAALVGGAAAADALAADDEAPQADLPDPGAGDEASDTGAEAPAPAAVGVGVPVAAGAGQPAASEEAPGAGAEGPAAGAPDVEEPGGAAAAAPETPAGPAPGAATDPEMPAAAAGAGSPAPEKPAPGKPAPEKPAIDAPGEPPEQSARPGMEPPAKPKVPKPKVPKPKVSKPKIPKAAAAAAAAVAGAAALAGTGAALAARKGKDDLDDGAAGAGPGPAEAPAASAPDQAPDAGKASPPPAGKQPPSAAPPAEQPAAEKPAKESGAGDASIPFARPRDEKDEPEQSSPESPTATPSAAKPPTPSPAELEAALKTLEAAMPPPNHPFQQPSPDPNPNSPEHPLEAPALDLSLPNVPSLFASLVKLNFLSKFVMLPTGFDPSALVKQKPGDDMFQIANLAALATNLFKSPSPFNIHFSTAMTIGKMLSAFIDDLSRGIILSWNITSLSIKFSGVIINGPIGILPPVA